MVSRLESRTGRSIACAVVLLLPRVSAQAAAVRPCSDPAVFPDAALNLLVLPYRYVGPSGNPEPRTASQQIGSLIHLELLFSAIKYGNIGATNLVDDGGGCEVDRVIEKVTRPSGRGAVASGHALVVVRGRLFSQGVDLYVQTYLRFFRQGEFRPVPESITASAGLSESTDHIELTATLPAQSLAFPPRKISRADLRRIDEEFRKTMVLRREPQTNSPGETLATDPRAISSYYVTRVSGEWMLMESMSGGPSGWVRAPLDDGAEQGEWTLRHWLPELTYVDGVSGYMRLRANEGTGLDTGRQQQLRGWIEKGLGGFERAVTAESAPAPYGIAAGIRGFLLWQRSDDQAARAQAKAYFMKAREHMSDYGAARNLAAVGESADVLLDKKALGHLHEELLGALGLEPRDPVLLANLETVYAAMSRNPTISPLSKATVAERTRVVQASKAPFDSSATATLSRLGELKQDERGTVIVLPTTGSFVSSTAELRPSAAAKLHVVAEALKGTTRPILVEAHIDPQAHAQELSASRAEAIRKYFIEAGLPSGQIQAIGLGPERPIGDNKTAAGRAKNRRVEIVVRRDEAFALP